METQLNTMPKPLPRVGLDRNQIKYILIIAMLVQFPSPQ